MSESISYKRLGEESPAEFFRTVVEPMADSFDPAQVLEYERVMREWDLQPAACAVSGPASIQTVYVLSRVTLGADIKITSVILDAMKRRYPDARIVFVANRKSAELFEGDARVEWMEADYPRTGPVSQRIAFGRDLRERLGGGGRIVIDPDSRMTQLGLVPVCEPTNYFRFPSRSTGEPDDNLTSLTNRWLSQAFGVNGMARLAPKSVRIEGEHPSASVSFGVGENESKRVAGDFETKLIRELGGRYRSIWIDRGAGGEEARRVTAAAGASGVSDRIRYWEGSFAGFVSVIAQSEFYIGYDSAGQHAAAALRIPLISIFKGAVSDVFRKRWAPRGPGWHLTIPADGIASDELLDRVRQALGR